MPPPIPPNLEKRSQKDVTRWFRRLMAVAIVCGALSIGSVVGVMANSFAGDAPPRWITSKRFNPNTGKTEQIKTVKR